MDAEDYEQILKYKLKSVYPAHFKKREKFLLRRKAVLYDIKGKISNAITIF